MYRYDELNESVENLPVHVKDNSHIFLRFVSVTSKIYYFSLRRQLPVRVPVVELPVPVGTGTASHGTDTTKNRSIVVSYRIVAPEETRIFHLHACEKSKAETAHLETNAMLAQFKGLAAHRH